MMGFLASSLLISCSAVAMETGYACFLVCRFNRVSLDRLLVEAKKRKDHTGLMRTQGVWIRLTA